MKPCTVAETLVYDYFDRLLSGPQSREMDHHVAECATCRDALHELEALRARVNSQSHSASPQRDLWPEIAARLISRSAHVGEAFRFSLWFAAAAATVCLLVGVAVLMFLNWGGAPVEMPASLSVLSTRGPLDDGMPGDVEKAEKVYEDATRLLLAQLDGPEAFRASEAGRAVEFSLGITDRAIREIKSALEEQPGDLDLARRLMAAYDKRVEVLRHVAGLSAAHRDRDERAL